MQYEKQHGLFPTLLLHALCMVVVLVLGSCGSNNSEGSDPSSQNNETQSDDDFVSLFDGISLDGWEGSPDNWKVEDGQLIGFTSADKPLENNTFLIWRGGEPGDFELKIDFKISEAGNSGVQYRSEELAEPKLALKGYQADIDGKNTYTGQNYEERGRGFLAKRGEISLLQADQEPEITGSLGDGEELKSSIHFEDWNTLHIIAKGNHLKHYINGILMSEVIDEDPGLRKMSGLLGLQVHRGPPMEVRYRNILYKDLSSQ